MMTVSTKRATSRTIVTMMIANLRGLTYRMLEILLSWARQCVGVFKYIAVDKKKGKLSVRKLSTFIVHRVFSVLLWPIDRSYTRFGETWETINHFFRDLPASALSHSSNTYYQCPSHALRLRNVINIALKIVNSFYFLDWSYLLDEIISLLTISM